MVDGIYLHVYIERDIKKRFHKIFSSYNLIALVGARQAGKTTFLKQQMKRMSSSYVLFDDPDARKLFEADIKKFELQYAEGRELMVLDEIQYCEDAGIKLKYLVDMDRKLWITSSSEILMEKDILSYLVGRVSIVKLYPFTLSEFLRARGQKAVEADMLARNIWEHMTYGGYPKVVLTKDPEMKRTILSDLYVTMLLKDVARTFSIEDINALESLAKYLAVTNGALISYEHVSKALGISFPTLKKYLNAMEKSYLITMVTPFFKNKSKEISKQPKVYFMDTGLRNVIADRFESEPDGLLFENYVLSEMIKSGLKPKYWRTKTKAEVDLIVEKNDMIIPIEVKLRSEPNKIERSLRSFIDSYKPKKAIVVTYKGKTGEMRVGSCKVVFTDVPGLLRILGSGSPTLSNLV